MTARQYAARGNGAGAGAVDPQLTASVPRPRAPDYGVSSERGFAMGLGDRRKRDGGSGPLANDARLEYGRRAVMASGTPPDASMEEAAIIDCLADVLHYATACGYAPAEVERLVTNARLHWHAEAVEPDDIERNWRQGGAS